jgi:hypothetical protein
MNRLIYCPSDDFVEEASALSKKNYLQILVGDNDYTKNLDFNRGKVSVISVPENKSCSFNTSVKKGFHQNIIYKNEFCIIKNNVNLFINDELIKPMYEERHVAKFVYLCEYGGDHSCKIIVDEKIEEEFTFVVD